jgi:DNA-binding transcriptional ArsR family regulator
MDAVAELEAKAEYVASRLSLLSNPKRLLILCHLTQGESSVGEIQQAVGMGQSALSQHLAKLREADIVATRRDAQTIYYRMADPETASLLNALYETFCAHAHGADAHGGDADAGEEGKDARAPKDRALG